MDYAFDLIVLGAGPGGYVAAIRAAQLGMKVAVVEKKAVGGVCLNIGCIPSKNLIASASALNAARSLAPLGVKTDLSGLDYAAVHAQSRKVADTLAKGVTFLLNKNGITLVNGKGTITDAHTIQVEGGEALTARNLLIATGSSPRVLPGLEFDGTKVLSSDDFLLSNRLPQSICIIGGGAIGCEFSYVLSSLGVSVTIVEMTSHLLPYEDEEVAKTLASSFKKRGISVQLESKATILDRSDKVTVEIENAKGVKKNVTVDQVLAVVGRVPNTGDIGLENLGIETQRGFIPVDVFGRTAVENVYAIGDVVPTTMLAHVASHEGEIAVEHMNGKTEAPKTSVVPNCVYCEPQVGGFGMTAAQAQQIGAKVFSFPFRAIGKAVAIGKTEGFVKLVTDDEGYLLGAHIIGADATELIGELAVAANGRIRGQELAGEIFAHPTLSEAIKECCCAFENRVIHL